MDNSSKKIVMIIAVATVGIMAVMAYNDYNRPAAESPPIASAPEAEPARKMSVATQEQARTPEPVNAASTPDDIPAINGEPSMILEGSNNVVNGEGNGDAPTTADDMQ